MWKKVQQFTETSANMNADSSLHETFCLCYFLPVKLIAGKLKESLENSCFKNYKKVRLLGNETQRNHGWLKTFAHYCTGTTKAL